MPARDDDVTSHPAPPAALPPDAPALRNLLRLSVPAVLVGVISALVLYALDWLSAEAEDVLWTVLPGALGVDPDSRWWIFGMLTGAGLLVGLVVWLVPGHGGRDSATTELIAPPLPLRVLPSLAVVTVLGLAGGVSLGPENPIIAINTALLVALVARLWPKVPTDLVVMLAAAATIGALFGTPVAAALVFTGVVAGFPRGGPLFDRLFLPLVSAGAGAMTMDAFGRPFASMDLPDLGVPDIGDVGISLAVATVAAGAALLGVLAFPYVHRFFHGMRNPVLYVTLGGVVLGVLGAIGGPLTLFKGSQQSFELVQQRADFSTWNLVLIFAVKLVALVIAAAAGFRGGRIFPAVFIGVAAGVAVNAAFPGAPLGLSVASGVLGVVLAVGRDGWIALFVAVAVVGDVGVLPVLCLAILPAWLLVRSAPEMLAAPEVTDEPVPRAGTGGD
ncbi:MULTISPECIES: ion channel protein [Oerskovia]|uniref:Ion channel protein n=2 Tax=Oerskovia TaxID=162491 RepID=A0ABR8V441_9CELL|nr:MULTISPECIES: ion channel protein [Oerskovia]MBD7999437.1 ion channel protein [Oerskovia gallyi]MBM7495356.1 H+/Cl- antiporter ClcA [Oerskovia paurometabola]